MTDNTPDEHGFVNPQDGDVAFYNTMMGEWRGDRIDVIIENVYDDHIAWHNYQIGAGADLQSGLHNLPYIPYDEKIDGMVAMYGNGATIQDVIFKAHPQTNEAYVYSDGAWRPASSVKLREAKRMKRNQSNCILYAALVIFAMGAIIFMMIYK